MYALGTEYKINVSVEPIQGFNLIDQDFELGLYVQSHNEVIFKKNNPSIKISEDGKNCMVCVSQQEALKIGKGPVKLKFIAHIQDFDFPDNVRTEIYNSICTGVTIT